MKNTTPYLLMHRYTIHKKISIDTETDGWTYEKQKDGWMDTWWCLISR